MAVDFSDKRFRSDFEAEKKRILAAIKDCEAMDKELTTTCGELKQSMSRARGAASLVVRMTEQIISNRNHRLALIKELRALKRDVLEREIKLAEKEDEAGKLINASGVSAALLSHLQAVILAPGGASALLEPAGAAPEEKPQAAASEEASSDEERYAQQRMRDMHELIDKLMSWFDDVQRLSPETAMQLMGMGSAVTRLLDLKDKITGKGSKEAP